jgi:hypothetical protein
MKAIDIPGGQARFREKNEVKIRHRQMIEAATLGALSALSKLPTDDPEKLKDLNMFELGLNAKEAQSIYDLEAALIVATLLDWDRPEAIPDVDTVGDLDIDVYDALRTALPQLGVLVDGEVDFAPPKPTDPEFEVSPTAPSAGSASDLRADQESPSTELQPPDGQSSPIAEPSLD